MKRRMNSLPWVLGLLCGLSAVVLALSAVVLAQLLWQWRWTLSRVTAALVLGLWMGSWCLFLRLLGRLRREESAFTKANARLLTQIGWSFIGMGAVQLIRGVAQALQTGPEASGWRLLETALQAGVLPVMLLGVAVVALVLGGLMRSAQELQQDADLTI